MINMVAYKQIQDYVKKTYGYVPKSCWITVSEVFFSCTHNLYGLLGYAFLYATLLLHNLEQYLRRLSRNSPFRLFPQYRQLMLFSSTVYHFIVILTQRAFGGYVLFFLTLTKINQQNRIERYFDLVLFSFVDVVYLSYVESIGR